MGMTEQASRRSQGTARSRGRVRDAAARMVLLLVAGSSLAVGCRDLESDDDLADETDTTGPGPDAATQTGDDSTGGVGSPEFCEGKVFVRYDVQDGEIDAFPDDLLTEDAPTATGVRVRHLHPNGSFAGFPGLFEGLATLDGFGVAAPLFLRLDGPIDPASLPTPGTETDPRHSSLLLVDLDAAAPTFLEFEWHVEPERGEASLLVVKPLRALRPGTRYGVAMTRAARDPDGDCIAPSETMRALFEGNTEDPALARIADRHADLRDRLVAAAAIEGPADLSAALVFTTQTVLHESTTIATAIAQASPPPVQPGDCTPQLGCLRCEVVLSMANFRSADGVLADELEPQSFYSLPVTTFLPPGSAPHPTIIYAHGLDGDRTYSANIALESCELGYAVVAIDAPKHGGHPDTALVQPALDLMGITADPDDPFVALRARDNFRQSTYEKLQLLRRIEVGMDVDGDGQPDLSVERLHYAGTSLGAVMAPHFLALAPQIHSATLMVGGVRLTDIISEPSELAGIVNLVTNGMHRADRMRFMAMIQAALDRGEPEVFAPYVLGDRLEGFAGRTPQILVQMAVEDTIVPNASTAHLARSLGIPVAGDLLVGMRDVAVESTLPLQANLASGRTAGLYQFADVLTDSSAIEPANHTNLPNNPLARDQRMAFILTAEDGAGAVLIDPFE